MHDIEPHDLKALMRSIDRSIRLDSGDLAKRVASKKRIRSFTVRCLVSSVIALASSVALLILTYDVESPQNNQIAHTDNLNPETDAFATGTIEFDSLFPMPVSTAELDASKAKLQELKSNLAKLNKTRQRQQRLLLREQLSRQSMGTIKIVDRGF